LWRPVIAGLCSITELNSMTFVDLMDAHEVLDIKDHVENIEMKRNRLNGQ
tara:strand:- start:196 stop:345 length:150 start_codon:yes stop_codon:yes gene_type:complete